MKKLIRFLPAMLLCIMTCMAFTSCDDDDDRAIVSTRLPADAKTFLSTYYPGQVVVSATLDKETYEAVLSNGHKVEFNQKGEWQDVDAPAGQVIPEGFYPAAIDIYVAEHYTGNGINEISRETSGYEVDLVNGVDLLFNTEGAFIGVDPD